MVALPPVIESTGIHDDVLFQSPPVFVSIRLKLQRGRSSKIYPVAAS
jgi:hypothetical protein